MGIGHRDVISACCQSADIRGGGSVVPVISIRRCSANCEEGGYGSGISSGTGFICNRCLPGDFAGLANGPVSGNNTLVCIGNGNSIATRTKSTDVLRGFKIAPCICIGGCSANGGYINGSVAIEGTGDVDCRAAQGEGCRFRNRPASNDISKGHIRNGHGIGPCCQSAEIGSCCPVAPQIGIG